MSEQNVGNLTQGLLASEQQRIEVEQKLAIKQEELSRKQEELSRNQAELASTKKELENVRKGLEHGHHLPAPNQKWLDDIQKRLKDIKDEVVKGHQQQVQLLEKLGDTSTAEPPTPDSQ